FGRLPEDLKKLLVQLDDGCGLVLAYLRRLILKEGDFASQEGTFLIQLLDLKPLTAFGNNIESSIVVLSADVEDGRRASHLSQRILPRSNHPKGFLLLNALAYQLLVARLEDVQRERSAGEQYQVERE